MSVARATRPIPTTIALLVGTFLSSLDVTVVGTALPRITGELGGLHLYPWVFSIYLLTSTLTVPVWGKLADVRGRRPTYLVAVTLFLAGSFACGAAPTMSLLVAARALQGLGAGGLVPLTQTIFGDIFPVETRARMQGVFALVWGVSSILGPTAGGAIVSFWSWPWVFYINLPVGAVAMLLFVSSFHEQVPVRPTRRQLFAALIPTIPIGLLRDRVTGLAVAIGALSGPMLFAFIAYVPLYLQGALGMEPVWAGLVTAPLSLAWSTATFVGGRLMLRTSFRSVIRGGMVSLVLGAGAFWLGLATLPSAFGWVVFSAATLLFGAGMGATFSLFFIAVQDRFGWERRGAVTALLTLSRQLGATTGVAALGAWIAAALRERLAGVPNAPSPDELLDPHRLQALSPAVLAPARGALGDSVVDVFAVVTLMGLVALVLTAVFPDIRLDAGRSPPRPEA